MWCRHETEVSRGSPQGSISGMPIAATQNALGQLFRTESKEEEIFMKTKRLLFISCLAAGALIASPSFGKPAKKSTGTTQSKANPMKPYSAMNNSKLFLSAICLLVLTLAAPLTTEAGRGGGGGGGRGGGGGFSGGMSAAAASLVAEWARAARVGAVVIGTVPAIGTAWRNWHRNNWHGNNWHNGHHHGNDVVFIGGFGFPWWWGWGPSWGWDYGYPYYGYGYYPYGYGGAYSYGYGGGGYGYGYDYPYGGNQYGNGYG